MRTDHDVGIDSLRTEGIALHRRAGFLPQIRQETHTTAASRRRKRIRSIAAVGRAVFLDTISNASDQSFSFSLRPTDGGPRQSGPPFLRPGFPTLRGVLRRLPEKRRSSARSVYEWRCRRLWAERRPLTASVAGTTEEPASNCRHRSCPFRHARSLLRKVAGQKEQRGAVEQQRERRCSGPSARQILHQDSPTCIQHQRVREPIRLDPIPARSAQHGPSRRNHRYRADQADLQAGPNGSAADAALMAILPKPRTPDKITAAQSNSGIRSLPRSLE